MVRLDNWLEKRVQINTWWEFKTEKITIDIDTDECIWLAHIFKNWKLLYLKISTFFKTLQIYWSFLSVTMAVLWGMKIIHLATLE